MKKKFLYSMLQASSFALPLTILSCANSSEPKNDQQIYNDLLSHFIDVNKIGKDFNGENIKIRDEFNPYIDNKNLSIDDPNYVPTQPNQLNMFKILLNEDWVYADKDTKYLDLDSIFYINDLDVASTNESTNKNYTLGFSFDYLTCDSFGNKAKPYISSNLETIVIPVKVSLIDKETYLIKATKFVDMMTMKIIDHTVNNFDDIGFNNQEGKSIIYPLTYKSNSPTPNDPNNIETITKPIKFMDIPSIVVDPFLELNAITSNNDSWKSSVIYNNEKISKWKGLSFLEVKSTISNAFKTPPNLVFKNKSFSYSIYEYAFDQHEWNYPRFTIEFRQNDQNNIISSESAKKYELNYIKRYSYVDKSYKFANPTSSDISSAVDKNSKIATDLSSFASSTTSVWQPQVTFSVEFIEKWSTKEGGLTEIVDMFNSGAQGFIPPAPFRYDILDDDYRNVRFEISKVSLNSSVNTTFDVEVKIIVGQKELEGSAVYTKKFNTKTWKWE